MVRNGQERPVAGRWSGNAAAGELEDFFLGLAHAEVAVEMHHSEDAADEGRQVRQVALPPAAEDGVVQCDHHGDAAAIDDAHVREIEAEVAATAALPLRDRILEVGLERVGNIVVQILVEEGDADASTPLELADRETLLSPSSGPSSLSPGNAGRFSMLIFGNARPAPEAL